MMCSCYTCSDITKYFPLRCLSQLYKPIQLSSETHYDYKFKMVTTTGTFILVVAVILSLLKIGTWQEKCLFLELVRMGK